MGASMNRLLGVDLDALVKDGRGLGAALAQGLGAIGEGLSSLSRGPRPTRRGSPPARPMRLARSRGSVDGSDAGCGHGVRQEVGGRPAARRRGVKVGAARGSLHGEASTASFPGADERGAGAV
jgi:hypothetical protein